VQTLAVLSKCGAYPHKCEATLRYLVDLLEAIFVPTVPVELPNGTTGTISMPKGLSLARRVGRGLGTMTVRQGANLRTVCEWKDLYLLEAKTPCQLAWCKAGCEVTVLTTAPSTAPSTEREEYHRRSTTPCLLTAEQKTNALGLTLISLKQFEEEKRAALERAKKGGAL